MMRFFSSNSTSPRRGSRRRADDGLPDGSSERPAIGVDEVLAFLERKRGSAGSARGDPGQIPAHVVDALGPGWVMRGGLGAGAYAKVFETTWAGTSKTNGATVPCAIKVMRDVDMESWEISRRFVRELLVLRRLREAPGVVSLYGCSTPSDRSSRHRRDLYLWFEACVVDFRQLTKMECYMTLPDAKRLTRELITAMRHIHAKDVIHRDIKPANLLLHGSGALKVCDFGLARIAPRERPAMPKPEGATPPPAPPRVLPADEADKASIDNADFEKLSIETGQKGESPQIEDPDIDVGDGESDEETNGGHQTPTVGERPEMRRTYTEHVVTRWYRSPELVLLQPYGFAVDVWAVACVVAECFLGTCKEVVEHREGRRPLFPGRSCFPLSPSAGGRGGWHQKNDQLQAIFRVRGTPSTSEIDSLEHDYKGMKAYLRRLQPRQPSDLQRVLRGVPSECVDLLDKMLTFLPEDRLSLDKALEHPYLALPPQTEQTVSRSMSSGFLQPSETAVGPAMSRIEDDDAWERVAQHRADRDMSNVLWRLVERFPSELAPRGGLLGHEELAETGPTSPRKRKSALSKTFSSLRSLLPSGSGDSRS